MNKTLFLAVMALCITALTFTACQDDGISSPIETGSNFIGGKIMNEDNVTIDEIEVIVISPYFDSKNPQFIYDTIYHKFIPCRDNIHFNFTLPNTIDERYFSSAKNLAYKTDSLSDKDAQFAQAHLFMNAYRSGNNIGSVYFQRKERESYIFMFADRDFSLKESILYNEVYYKNKLNCKKGWNITKRTFHGDFPEDFITEDETVTLNQIKWYIYLWDMEEN